MSDLQEIVPKADFIENVAEFVKDRTLEDAMREVQEKHQRYQYVEQQINQRKTRLTLKQPEIKKCLDAVDLLIQRKEAGDEPTLLDFSLSDQVYARAKIQNVESVGLWLGAGIMVEYSLEDAKQLLEQQLAGCSKQLEAAQQDYDYVKDQVTTTEVSMARIYNYDVMRRKEQKS